MGLDIEVAFKRFSKRVKSNEAIYLSSSLSVLNKTGGNIIKVFNSIERNMYNRKKLNNELKSLTSSSKLIMYVLILVPPLFIVFIMVSSHKSVEYSSFVSKFINEFLFPCLNKFITCKISSFSFDIFLNII